MQSRFAGITSRAFVLATVFAVAAAAPRRAQAQIADISCDRDGAREVRSLKFEGNTTFKSDELSTRVVTTPSSFTRRFFGWFFHAGSARCLPEEGLAQDVANLKGFYKINGFYATKVDTVVTPLSPDRVAVTFRINEGPPLRADTVTITGLDSVPDREAVLRDLLVKVGERVGQSQLFADRDSIVARLHDQGFPFATVFSNFATHIGRERAEITLDVVTGPRTRIGTIDVQRVGPEDRRAPGDGVGFVEAGAPGIDSSVVLDLLGFRSGNWYSDRALSEATRNLYNLGAYRHVGIAVDTTHQAADTLVTVKVDLREDFLRQVQLEEGWGNLDCFKVDAQYTDKNFLERAWRLDVTGRASKLGYGSPTDSRATKNLCYRPLMDQDTIGSSKLNYYAGLTVRQPTLFGGHWVPAYAAYTERRGEWKAYLRTTYVGLDVSATRNIGRQMPFRLGYTLELGKTEAEAAVLCAVFARCEGPDRSELSATRRFAAASASLQQSTIDNPVSPRSGFAWAAILRAGNPIIGSDSGLSFQKITGEFSFYRPVTSRITFAERVRAGYVAAGNGTPPPQERLYAGGANSDRGFGENELGPLSYLMDFSSFKKVPLGTGSDTVALIANPQATAARTVPVGGNALVIFNTELRIRDPFFPELIEYIPFVDAGQLWTREQATNKINLDRLIVTPGLGVRYFSPVGPIQANAGYNPSRRNRTGPAYWAAIGDTLTVNSPLLCVTPPAAPPVPILVEKGKLIRTIGDCPGVFVPFRSNNFFNQFVFTISLSASF